MGVPSCLFPVLVGLLFACQAKSQDAAGTFALTGVEVTITSADGSVDTREQATYPKAVLSSKKLTVDQQLEVTFSLEGGKAQQLMVALISKSTSAAGYVIPKSKKGGSYSAVLNFAALEKQIGRLTGEYEVVVLVGSPSVATGLRWSLATVVFDSKAEVKPVQKSLANQRHVFVKPEIHHIFRAPDKRAPSTISLAFTGAAFAPLAVLLISLGVVGANFKGYPREASGAFSNLLFHCSIGSMLALFLLFWLQLNLAQTLPLVAGLGVVIAFFGYQALSALADLRLKKD